MLGRESVLLLKQIMHVNQVVVEVGERDAIPSVGGHFRRDGIAVRRQVLFR